MEFRPRVSAFHYEMYVWQLREAFRLPFFLALAVLLPKPENRDSKCACQHAAWASSVPVRSITDGVENIRRIWYSLWAVGLHSQTRTARVAVNLRRDTCFVWGLRGRWPWPFRAIPLSFEPFASAVSVSFGQVSA